MTGLTCLLCRIKDTGDQVSYDRSNRLVCRIKDTRDLVSYDRANLVYRIKDTRDQVSYDRANLFGVEDQGYWGSSIL